MKFLIIQSAFIGDVILATAMVEKLHSAFPDSKIDMLVRSGNKSLLENNPCLNKVIVWNKKENKIGNLLKVISSVRKEKYDAVINAHRFLSSGLITALSGAKEKVGFNKNPLSFLFTRKMEHSIDGVHETERNQKLIAHFAPGKPSVPRLYLAADDNATRQFKIDEQGNRRKYVCIAPASVWFTKQFPKEKWIEFINQIPDEISIYLLGSESDSKLCEHILLQTSNLKPQTSNLSGKLSFLQTASLMRDAVMNYCNDSAPLHIASAVNAPVTAVFCSTVPEFGFGPLSEKSFIVQTKEKLDCRPCGLHGYKKCPRGHFSCAFSIEINELLTVLK
ncbi:MAG TPA: glycosyltransferase family 9 protein [Bacteroidia bacterium]|nr:glycosyltransferase family 9 protein [Bacteroidia bacterium]